MTPDNLRPEYDFRESVPNPFAGRIARKSADSFVIPDDLRERYPTPEAVEAALRRLIELEPAGRPK